MIYTIGHKASYEQYLSEQGKDCRKLGKGEYQGKPYSGGAAFETKDAALDYLHGVDRLTGFAVYGLLADWEADTEQLPGEPFRHLLRDAQIVKA